MPSPRTPLRRLVALVPSALRLCLWAGAVAAGFLVLQAYERAPGTATASPSTWPGGEAVALHPTRPTLLVFFHPQCPCSHSTLDGLEHLVTDLGSDAVAATVVLYRPAVVPEDWVDESVARRARRLPGFRTVEDVEGVLTRRFAATTSGHVALYAPDGRVLFTGGITGARGHDGRNAHRDALAGAVRTGVPVPDPRPVFGCPIVPVCEAHEAVAAPTQGARP
jgi:hypothetical protein